MWLTFPSGSASPPQPRLDTDTTHTYRPFIDGLRAVSILAVVGYHVGLPGFSGGFIGVDVFFVISGFLIIGQIRSGLLADRFSFYGFYARRVLRILPPFLLVIAVCAIVGPFVMATPHQLEGFLPRVIAAPLMVSNLQYMFGTGYFNLVSDARPLLHTWTLSVEEQFYIFGPVILLILVKLGRSRFGVLAPLIVLALFAVSLVGCVSKSWSFSAFPPFFLVQWRAWEFIAGGLIGGSATLIYERRPPPWVWDGLAILGLAAIVAATVFITESVPYPSFRVLLPVAGAFLVILAGLAAPRNLVARALSTAPMVAIGLVSYSWYLWHWPLISFTRIADFEESSPPLDFLAGGVAAFLLAVATYRYLELPIKRWRQRANLPQIARTVVANGVAASILLAGVGGAISLLALQRAETHVAAKYGDHGDGEYDGCIIRNHGLPEGCDGRPGAILLGDSHAVVLYNAFAGELAKEGRQLIGFARNGCGPLFAVQQPNPPFFCASFAPEFGELLRGAGRPPVPVLITARWMRVARYADETSGFSIQLRAMLAGLEPARRQIVLIGPVPEFPMNSLSCIVLADRYGIDRTHCAVPRAEIDSRRASVVAELAKTAGEFPNVRFVDPIDLFCDAEWCRPNHGDLMYFKDRDHLTMAGAARVFGAFRSELLAAVGVGPNVGALMPASN
jgi:peptidoglycan/LPS O-acetylase OafA/YrhL